MSFPNSAFWSHLLATVGVEICCVAALGFLAQLIFRRAVWQRAIWQITLISLLLLPASEWTGIGRGMVGFLISKKPAAQTAPASGLMTANPKIARRLANRTLDWRPAAGRLAVWWPGWVWLAGTFIVLGRMAAAQVLLLALRLGREKIAASLLQERVLQVAKSVGLRRKICLLRMPEAISPMAFGVLRPSIGLPPGFETRFSASEQEAVLAHELAHLAALDPLWFLLADFASALLWWHPLAWCVRRWLHVSSELAADEAAALVPDGPGSLAKCLVVLGKEMTAGRGCGWVGINGGFRSKLGKRVERLMRMSSGTSRPLADRVGAAIRIAVAIFVVPTVVLLSGSFQYAQGQNADGLRGELRRSWNSSPGALLLLAALDAGKQKEDIAARVQDAKLYYEMGNLDKAEAILLQVLKDDLSNRTARYFLDLIKEAQDMNRERKGPIIPIPLATNNLVYISKERRNILSKLDRIRYKSVQYDLPLPEVLDRLTVESKKRDSDGKAINFFIKQTSDADVGVPPDAGVGAPLDAVAATAPNPAGAMSEVTIRISAPLQNLRLADVLNAIVMMADQPIKYTVEDYGVVFSPKPAEVVTLYSKVFHVDPATFAQDLENIYGRNFNSANSSASAGIEMDDGPRRAEDGYDALGGPGGKSTQFDFVAKTNRTIELDKMVRAYFSAEGVDLTDPGKSAFYNDRLGLLLVRASANDLEIIQGAVVSLDQPQQTQVAITAKLIEADAASLKGLALDWSNLSQGLTKVLTEAQYRAALGEIERANIDILTLPRISSDSGRAMSASSDRNNNLSLNVIPTVRPDGFSIEMIAILSIKTDGNSRFNWHIGHPLDVRDGQTLFGVLTNQPPDGRMVWMVFITPRIIDSAGNPAHADEQVFPQSSHVLK